MNKQLAPLPVDYLAALRTLCRLLSQDPLTVDEVRHSLSDLALPASVEPEPGSTVPAFVRIPLPAGAHLTLEELQAAFGASRALPGLHRGAPLEYLIPVDLPGAPYTCAVLIEKLADRPFVEVVTLRRDMRL